MFWLFLLLAWLIAPIVLTILYVVALNEKSALKKEVSFLNQQINELRSKISKISTGEHIPDKSDIMPVVSETKPVPEPAPRPTPQYNNLYKNDKTDTVVAEQNKPVPETVKVTTEQNIPAPMPEKVVPEQKTVVKTEQAVPKKKTSAMSIILILGALFLCLSGFIFAAATWGVMNTFFKTGVLLSFSIFFFGMHSFTERKLKLVQTGRIFYIIGSFFLPAAFVAAGILGVFGEYLSFSGDGCLLMTAITTFSFCIPFFKGAHDYKSKIFASVSHYSFSVTIFLLLLHFIPRADVAILVNAVYSFAVIITEPLVKKLYDKIFGEGNVFSAIYSYFTIISVTILSLLSNFIFIEETMNIITLIAFAIYAITFLTKTVSEKNGMLSVSLFAIFITISLFTGLDPDTFSSVILIITTTAVIYGVLSFMGIFPEEMQKILKYFGIFVASTAGILAVIDVIICLAGEETPSLTTVISSFMITAEMIILSLRHKTNTLKSLTFVSFIWFIVSFILLFELSFIGNLIIPFIVVLAYYFLSSITPLKNVLKSEYANDIIFGVFSLISSFIASTDDAASRFISIAILIISAVSMVICNRGKIAVVFCPIFTFQLALPIFTLTSFSYDIDVSNLGISIVLVLFCIMASAFLFIPKAKDYAVSYGISLLAVIPIFFISFLLCKDASFIPLIFVIGYTVVLFIKHSLPNGKYSDVNLINGAVLLTSFVMGIEFLDGAAFVFCFPAIVMMVIFAFSLLSAMHKAFSNVNRPIQKFLWFSLPVMSSVLMISGCAADELSIVIFGTILLICAGVTSVFGKNTLNLIPPIIILPIVVYELCAAEMLIIPLIILVIAGRLLFREKLFDNVNSDIFSIGAFLPVIVFFFSEPNDMMGWIGILVLALLILNLIRKEHSPISNKILITVSGLFIFPIVWFQPFVEIPELISVQFSLLPVLFYCVLIKFIWKDYPKATDTFAFISAIVSLVILFIASFISGASFDAVFIGVLLFIMLIVSFIIKKKRWFVLSVSSMVVSGILLSFGRKDSIAWLIYLALAGVILIAMGLANEMKKQQLKTGEETKLSRFMSDWTW
ncbi:MAG: hypothetical protein IJ330_00405 [Oscillospiraceae bacterium]|nr:hypothetical protein [Oscillospiraceae bacterium]